MKRILILFAVLGTVISCLDKPTYTQSGVIFATFEYNGTNVGNMFGADSLFFDTEYKVGVGWDLLAFYHDVDKTTSEFNGGFMLSCLAVPESEKTDGLQNNRCRANAKHPKTGTNRFLVFCQTDKMPEHDMGFSFVPSGGSTGTCTMVSCQVNNTVAMADSIKAQFGLGDKLFLKAKGFLDGKETGTAEMTLAEFSSVKDSIVSCWTIFDISKLGTIDKVDFEIVGGPEGKELPMTVCIDNVVANISLTY